MAEAGKCLQAGHCMHLDWLFSPSFIHLCVPQPHQAAMCHNITHRKLSITSSCSLSEMYEKYILAMHTSIKAQRLKCLRAQRFGPNCRLKASSSDVVTKGIVQ